MAMKRKAVSQVNSRVKTVKQGLEGAELDKRVQALLVPTLALTVGAESTARSPFNQRFVDLIGTVLQDENKRLSDDVNTKEAAFSALLPAKGTREAAFEAAKADSAAKQEALTAAKKAASEAAGKVKEAVQSLKDALRAQKDGNSDLEAHEAKKGQLETAVKDQLTPLIEGSAGEEKEKKTKAVMKIGGEWKMDMSLLATAEPVLLKDISERGAFDGTCLEQLQGAFTAAVASIGEKLNEGAPGKAERAAAVDTAQAGKDAADAAHSEAKAAANTAKEAKDAASAAEKAAGQSVTDFMPDMKKSGDSFDAAKEALKDFAAVLTAYDELKAWKESDFVVEEPEPKKAAVEEAPAQEAPAEAA